MVFYFFLKEWSIKTDLYDKDDYDTIYPSNKFLGCIGDIVEVKNKLYVVVDYAIERGEE